MSALKSQSTKGAKVFISYSHKDEQYLEALEAHLALLRRQSIIENWHDRKIEAGTEWSHEISDNLRNADIVILLISADFLASDYCYDTEVKQALAKHNAGEAVVIPIIIRPCDWGAAPFAQLQALPRNAKPISAFENQDEAFLEIAKAIRQIAESVEPSENLSSTNTIEIQLNVDFDNFSPENEKAFLEAIRTLLDTAADLKIISKRKGSTFLKLKLSRADIERIRLAAETGELSDFPIVKAEVVPDEEYSLDSSQRPRVFVGSSSEGLTIAEMIQLNLDHLCEVTVWHQGVFSPSSGTLQSLLEMSQNVDFAILVLTPDDLVASRGESMISPRDNVIFELGLFMGSLGSERTMIVYDRTSDLKIPSDLAGVTMITYQPHSTGDLEATLGAPCTRLKQQVKKHGRRNG